MDRVWNAMEVAFLLGVGATTWIWYTNRVRVKEEIVVQRRSFSSVKKKKQKRGETVSSQEDSPEMDHGVSLYKLDNLAKTWADHLELDDEMKPKFENENCKLVSLKTFMDSLHVPGGVDLRKLTVTIVTTLGMQLLLPLVGQIPKLSKPEEREIDPFFLEVGKIVMRNLVSPITISALSITMHKTAQGMFEKFDCVEALKKGVSGVEPMTPSFDCHFPNPFVIPHDLHRVMDILNEHPQKSDEKGKNAPRPANGKFLPGLHFGAPGLHRRESKLEIALSRALVVIFNKLASNLFAEEESDSEFVLYLDLPGSDKGAKITTVQGLLQALMEHENCDARVNIRSQLTSFGFMLVVKGDFEQENDQENWFHVPVLVPMRTGISDNHGEEIYAPLTHCGLVAEIELPGFPAAKVEWYQNVGSFTGWTPCVWYDLPWHNGKGTEKLHQNDWNKKDQLLAVACCSVVSVLSALVVKHKNIIGGAYFYTGVCLDSVGLVEYAVTGKSSIFPFILSGQARTDLLLELYSLSGSSPQKEFFQDVFHIVAHALIHMPQDIDIKPSSILDACDRLDRILPDHTPFKLVYDCREQISSLKAFVEQNKDLIPF